MSKYIIKYIGTFLASVTILFFALSCLVSAQETLPQSASFSEIDVNSNGFISKAEAINRSDLSKNWQLVDKDKNGKIDIDEFVAYESTGRFSPPEDSDVAELGAAPMD